MKRQHTHQRGVTLFEMLLVLMVMAVVIVSVIQYAQTLREETAAERYGKKLYEYGQAVREYVFDKSAEVRAGDPIPGVTWDGNFDSFTAVGVDWLKPAMAGLNSDGQPYLREDFTFGSGVEPLAVRRKETGSNPKTFDGDEAFATYVGFEDPAQKKTSALTIKIIAGLLYGAEEGKVIVLPDLSLDAARYATDRYSTSLGVAAFEYDIYADFSNPSAYNPEAEPITGRLSSLGEEDDFLRTDGLNYMRKALAFGDEDDKADLNLPGAVGDMDIVGVENIYFDDDADAGALNKLEHLHELNFHTSSSATKIQSLDVMTFKDGGAINNLKTLNFASLGKILGLRRLIFDGNKYADITKVSRINMTNNKLEPTLISNLHKLNMQTDATATINFVDQINMKGAGRINNVGQVTLSSGAGINMMRFYMCNTENGRQTYLAGLGGSACFVIRDDKDAACKIQHRTTGLNPNFYLTTNEGGCTFGCIVWDNYYFDIDYFCIKRNSKSGSDQGGISALY